MDFELKIFEIVFRYRSFKNWPWPVKRIEDEMGRGRTIWWQNAYCDNNCKSFL